MPYLPLGYRAVSYRYKNVLCFMPVIFLQRQSVERGLLLDIIMASSQPLWVIVQELCQPRGGRPGLSVLTSLLVSVSACP